MSTIREIARLAGVSPATVSRTFTSPGLINEQTQQRVLEAAERLNYHPRARRAVPHMPSDGVSASQGAIGFQFFSATNTPGDTLVANTFYAPILAGAQAEAAALGLHLLIHTTNPHSLSVELPRMAQERAIAGMLLVGTTDTAVIDAFADHVPHIILVDNRDERGVRYESVISDGVGGGYAATRYLLELGHRRIGFFMGEPYAATFRDRRRGWLSALFDAGITPDHRLVTPGGVTDEEHEAQMLALLSAPDRPTALLTANDNFAFLALRMCRSLGLRVPEDLSLIGFDDIAFARETVPALTTVRVEKEVMGRVAVRLLHARMQSAEMAPPAAEPPICHDIPVSLVVRGTCAPLSDGQP